MSLLLIIDTDRCGTLKQQLEQTDFYTWFVPKYLIEILELPIQS